MQLVEGAEIGGAQIGDDPLEDLEVVGVGHPVAGIQRVLPGLALTNDARLERPADHRPRGDLIEHDVLALEIILQGLPGQLQGVPKASKRALLFQGGEGTRNLQGLLQAHEGMVEGVEALAPAGHGVGHRGLSCE